MATLVPCPSCARHVRADESTCPFCAVTVEAKPRTLDPIPGDRLLARTALTFATVAATALAGCGKEAAVEPLANTAPAYGVPVVMTDAGPVEQNAVPAYGVPPVEPTPVPTTSSSGATSAKPPVEKPQPTAVPAYGVPPINRNPTPEPRKK